MRAAGWSLAGHGLSQVIKLGSNLVLTRLLAPELYGVMAIGYVVLTGLGMFSDIGLNAGAIRSQRGDEPTFLNVGWIVQFGRGVVIMLAALFFSGALKVAALNGWVPEHSVYANPVLPLLIAVVSSQSLIESCESTKVWWARRHMQLAPLIKIELASQVATTIVMIVWALLSPSVWTLAGGWIFGALLKAVLTHAVLPGPPNRLEWDPQAFREIVQFGKWVFLSSSFFFLLSAADRILLGGMLTSQTMGFYSVAFTLVSVVQVAVQRIAGSVVLPALGEVFRTGPEQLKQTFYRIRRPMDLACLVPAGALVVLGEPVVHLLYDPRYAPAGWMLSVLAVTLVATRMTVFDQCLIAMGRVKGLSLLNAIRLVIVYSTIPLGYLVYGMQGAIMAVAISSLLNSLAVLVFQGRLHLLDVQRELLAFPMFAAGLLGGWILAQLIEFVRKLAA